MNREDIIRMAQEAGFDTDLPPFKDGTAIALKLAALVASAEREACARGQMIPLIIEDKYVRNYLWERGLVAVEDRCMRSHPHEKMDEYCQHKTNLARLMNKEAQDDARRNT